MEGADGAADLDVGTPVVGGVHQVDNPAFGPDGTLYATFSGTRGQRVPVSVFRVAGDDAKTPFLKDVTNATSMACDPAGVLHVTSRYDGSVRKVQPDGTSEIVAHDLGVACGIAFGSDGTMFVGDRSGTVFRVGSSAHVVPFVSLPPSLAAFHLAMGPDDALYVTGPTMATYDHVYRIDRQGAVSVVSSEFGRPQGLAVDESRHPLRGGRARRRRGALPRAPRRRARAGRGGHVARGCRLRPARRARRRLQRHPLSTRQRAAALESLMNQLFATKSLDRLVSDTEEPSHQLRRTLGVVQLTALGIGAIIGAGIFSSVGSAAAGGSEHLGAGPAIMVSFVLTAIACGFAALCYAEFAAMVPVAGSAYTYAYATLGEVIAWIIGWDLILEYAIGNVAVAVSWSGYFQELLRGLGVRVARLARDGLPVGRAGRAPGGGHGGGRRRRGRPERAWCGRPPRCSRRRRAWRASPSSSICRRS